MARKKKVTQVTKETVNSEKEAQVVSSVNKEETVKNDLPVEKIEKKIRKNIKQEISYSQNAIDMIKQFEGLRLSTYKCTSGRNSIGYGTTYIDNQPIASNLRITEDKASELLVKDVEKISKQISNLLRVNITQNQFDALVSFAYNIGINQFARSALLRLININDIEGASKQFIRWNKSSGVEQSGLTRRRIAEADLFCKN